MRRWYGIAGVALGLLSAVATGHGQPVSARPNFSGVWMLNRDLSDRPLQADISASPSEQGGDRANPGESGARGEFDRATGRGRSGGAENRGYRGDRFGPMGNTPDRRSTIDALTSELRNPSPSLMISHADPTLTITGAGDRTRLFQTNGRKDPHQVGPATALSTTRWDGDRLVTEYEIGNDRKIRIIYSLVASTRQLLEQVTFPNGQTIKRVYDPARSLKR
jgi:hypothetical protein